jgi:hypothetical protein
VSVQTITQAVNALVLGLGQIKDEIKELQQVGLPADDQFVHVIQVSPPITFFLLLSANAILTSPPTLAFR